MQSGGTCSAMLGDLYIEVGSDGNGDYAGLVDRKSYCVRLRSGILEIQADLMLNPSTDRYEFYRPEAGWTLQTKTIGKVVIETRFGAEAAPPGSPALSMAYVVQPRIVSFTPELANFNSSGLTITLQPYGAFEPGTVNGTSVSAQLPDLIPAVPVFSLPLQGGATAPAQRFVATFKWAYTPIPGGYDFASFRFYQTAWTYGVNPALGLKRPDNLPEFRTSGVDSHTARMPQYNLRCDRGVVKAGTSGCVFPDAAPVFSMAGSPSQFYDVAQHIADAQTKVDGPGTPSPKSVLSPGRFKLLAGTRALADTSGDASYGGLNYLKDDALTDRNRDAACRLTNSLINLRGNPRSASCAIGSPIVCTCDEYPFAATRQGASFAPDATSVRFVPKAQNEQSGSQFGTFLLAERVLPDFAGVDPFWVDPRL